MSPWDMIAGTPNELKTAQTLTPAQKSIANQQLQGLGPAQSAGLDRLRRLLSGDPSAYQAFEAPYMRQFREQIVPGISEGFAGMGSHGALSSSGFQQSLGSAATGLSERLASLRENLAMQAQGLLQGQQQIGQQPQFQNYIQGGTEGFVPQLAGAALGVGLNYGIGQLGNADINSLGGGAGRFGPGSGVGQLPTQGPVRFGQSNQLWGDR